MFQELLKTWLQGLKKIRAVLLSHMGKNGGSKKNGSFALPETNIALKKKAIPKGNCRIPSIHFQVRAVSFKEGRWKNMLVKLDPFPF